MPALEMDRDNALKRIKEKSLISWMAPARPFKRRDRDFWVTIITIATLFGVVLFLIEGFMPILLIISIIFLMYVLSTVEPEKIDYDVTNFGIRIGGKLVDWDQLGRFWFSRRMGSEVLVFETFVAPGRLEVIIEPGDREKLTKILNDYLMHEEVPPSGLDKLTNWFGRRLPQTK